MLRLSITKGSRASGVGDKSKVSPSESCHGKDLKKRSRRRRKLHLLSHYRVFGVWLLTFIKGGGESGAHIWKCPCVRFSGEKYATGGSHSASSNGFFHFLGSNAEWKGVIFPGRIEAKPKLTTKCNLDWKVKANRNKQIQETFSPVVRYLIRNLPSSVHAKYLTQMSASVSVTVTRAHVN